MALNLIVATSPVAKAGAARSGKPPLLFHGIRRTLIRKSLAKLNAIVNSDFRENARAANLQYDPSLITNVSRTADNNAFLRVIQRLTDALAAHEGDDF